MKCARCSLLQAVSCRLGWTLCTATCWRMVTTCLNRCSLTLSHPLHLRPSLLFFCPNSYSQSPAARHAPRGRWLQDQSASDRARPCLFYAFICLFTFSLHLLLHASGCILPCIAEPSGLNIEADEHWHHQQKCFYNYGWFLQMKS